MQENNHLIIAEDDSINIISVLKLLLLQKKVILKITIFCMLIGVFIAVFSRNQYTSVSTFVPLQAESNSSELGGLASLAGLNTGGINKTSISPNLYPKIVRSYPYQKDLLETPLTIEGQNNLVTYKKYYKDIYKPSFLSNFKKYTIGLPSVLISFFRDKKDEDLSTTISSVNETIYRISEEDYLLIELLSSQINIEVNSDEGFISMSVTLEEPKAAAEMALMAQQTLQKYVLYFKTQKSNDQLQYINERFLEKKKEFNTIKNTLARFQDRNYGINTALGKTKLLQLQSDYNIAFNVYSGLANQLEKQKIKVKEDTPLFTILDPVVVPKVKSKPKRVLIIVICTFFGFVFSIAYVFGKKILDKFKTKWLQHS
jgi:capsular polysaccharide biosynthesis protein